MYVPTLQGGNSLASFQMFRYTYPYLLKEIRKWTMDELTNTKPKYHHKRIMQAATRAVLRYSANEFGVRKVMGRAEGENIASQKIIARLAEEMSGGVVEPKRGREKWPETKKGGEERDVLTWEWSVRPDGEFEGELEGELESEK